MSIEMTVFHSKVARRLFILFVAAALVPIVLLAILAQSSVSDTLREFSQQQLRDQAKFFGAGLYDRMVEIEQTMGQVAERARDGALKERGADRTRLATEFSSLTLVRDGARIALAGAPHAFPVLDERARRHVEGGGTVIIAAAPTDGAPSLTFLRALDGDPRELIVGVPRSEFLFGGTDSLPSGADICVFSGSLALYCSKPLAADAVPASPNGDVRIVYEGTAYQGAAWGLFLDARYLTPDWRVVASRTEASVFAPVGDFSEMFRMTAALTVILIMFLTVRQVRRQLGPLESLTEATKRVGTVDFKAVKIESRDEFEQLGDAFNKMAHRLGRQLAALKANAELDRRILAEAGVDSVMEGALEHMTRVLPADVVAIAVLDPDGSAQPWVCEKGAPGAQKGARVRVSESEIGFLAAQRNGAMLGRRAEEPSYVMPLRALGASHVAAFPVIWEDRVAGILAFGFRRAVELSPDDHTHARDLADRVGVALTSANRSEELYRQARFDALTGLNNRWYFRDRLAEVCAVADRGRQPIVLLCMDLDRFKSVNDSVGHAAGDQLLQEVGARLRMQSRATDLLARLGGDEFALAITGPGAAREARAVIGKVLDAMAQPFRVAGREHFITARLGVTTYPADANDADTLMRNAEIALDRAKADANARYAFFEARMNEQVAERVALEQDLHRALERDELILHYQPQKDYGTGRISGAEALVRWQHPERGLVPPDSFISVAEESGMIEGLGEWVLRNTCRQFRAWRDAGIAPPYVSVNVSTKQLLVERFAERVQVILRETDVAPACIEFEITEGLLMQDSPVVAANLQRLRVLGLRFALDDFGTGFSSLAYLKRLPIDVLKIDRYFVRDLATSVDAQAIVNAMLAMAAALGKQVIAEGVETEEQLAYLRAQRCFLIQGFYFSKPLPAAEFAALMRKERGADLRVVSFPPRG